MLIESKFKYIYNHIIQKVNKFKLKSYIVCMTINMNKNINNKDSKY